MKRRLFILVVFWQISCTGGHSSLNIADQKAFELFGVTFFSDPMSVSLSEIHLGTAVAGHEGKNEEVVVEGNLVEIGQHQTHAIIEDEDARLLVVLTQLNYPDRLRKRYKKNSRIKILGAVKGGQKGLPYIQANSINLVSNNGKKSI
ncbi:MAG: hypothetical protein R3B45_14105 [Bdellovibrionota bacterium]